MMNPATILEVVGTSLLLDAPGEPPSVSVTGPRTIDAQLDSYALVANPADATSDVLASRIHADMARRGFRLAPREHAQIVVRFTTLSSPAEGDRVKVTALLTLEDADEQVLWVAWSAGEVLATTLSSRLREDVAALTEALPERVQIHGA